MHELAQRYPMERFAQWHPMEELPQRFPTVKKVNTRDQLVRHTKNKYVKIPYVKFVLQDSLSQSRR